MVGRAALVDDGVGAVLGMGHGGESLLLTLLAHHALAHEVLARHTGVVSHLYSVQILGKLTCCSFADPDPSRYNVHRIRMRQLVSTEKCHKKLKKTS